ncbi:hypothetical protein Ocin01_08996 [Orchesella cincta]|uniref:Uncharacterized protein n=1 Tax=Orchesella cincta TaxID=48709 RepID=A0A1D2MXH3_ORCCI|nr:hypothetical protein Ocin01_08996 [Orchesella cincta]
MVVADKGALALLQPQLILAQSGSNTAKGYRRVSNHSVVTPYSTSTSSLSSSSGSPKKELKVSPYKRHRTLSMPSCGVTAQLTRQLKKESTPESPDSASTDKGQSTQSKLKKTCYDVVIIGCCNVGKATLAEFFSKGGSSGSDPGIGSDFEEDDDRKFSFSPVKHNVFNIHTAVSFSIFHPILPHLFNLT